MKTAFLSEFAALRGILLQFMAIFVVVGLIVGIGMQSAAGSSACIAAMAPIMLTMAYTTYDSTNGWERFRATLPVSRAALVTGRYANILVASLAMLVVAMVLGLAMALFVPASMAQAGRVLDAFPGIAAASLFGMCIVFVMVSLVLPLFMRFGMTKAMRFVPVCIALAFVAFMAAMPSLPVQGALDAVDAWFSTPASIAAGVVIVLAVTLAVYSASCAVSIALYRTKEL